ncbi:OsmC-like protein [Motilibacter rhizosphaerae]|uniref:OsmC-like protein n=1 Tax=Motilibacter rhizosphaerae TaxID=598652 RepID=A0A4Q7N7E2_9ACTN|nr:OsmC family protein [Motilibacter rhizosphaerae]RZS77565.1 OsmC-like protein [Motilibacter rhizosphaerae]
MPTTYAVRVAAGSLRDQLRQDLVLPHPWTSEGVVAELQFSGAHVLHLAVAGCVLNDTYREARGLGVELAGVLVTAEGGFAPETWASEGVQYRVELDSPAAPEELARLLQVVDDVAEVPKALRAGAAVTRVG